MNKQISRFEIGAALSEVFNGIAPVMKNALVAVYECDLAGAGGGIKESRVITHQSKIIRVRFYLP